MTLPWGARSASVAYTSTGAVWFSIAPMNEVTRARDSACCTRMRKTSRLTAISRSANFTFPRCISFAARNMVNRLRRTVANRQLSCGQSKM